MRAISLVCSCPFVKVRPWKHLHFLDRLPPKQCTFWNALEKFYIFKQTSALDFQELHIKHISDVCLSGNEPWNEIKKSFFLPGWRHRSSGYMWSLMRAQKYPLPRAEALTCRGSVSSQRVAPSARLWMSVGSRPALMWTADAWLWERGHLLPSSRPSQLRAQLLLHSILPEPHRCPWIFTTWEPASTFPLRPRAVHPKTQFFIQNYLFLLISKKITYTVHVHRYTRPLNETPATGKCNLKTWFHLSFWNYLYSSS